MLDFQHTELLQSRYRTITVKTLLRATTHGTLTIVTVLVLCHEEPQEVIFLHGIWRHIKEFGIEGQIPRISSPVKPEKRCYKTSGSKTTRQSKYHLDLFANEELSRG